MSAAGGAGPARRLVLPAGLIERLSRHARRLRPQECCGVLIGRTGGETHRVTALTEADNVWPGDRRRRYEIEPETLLSAHVAAREAGVEVVGYYHSHPASPPVPSDFDRRRAWPGPSYLIASLCDPHEVELRSWRLESDGRFVEEWIERLE